MSVLFVMLLLLRLCDASRFSPKFGVIQIRNEETREGVGQ